MRWFAIKMISGVPLAMFASCAVLLFCTVDAAPTSSASIVTIGNTRQLQFLPPIPGYIPVYIRPGDTPLENINAELAAAFRHNGIRPAGKYSVAGGRAKNVLTGRKSKVAQPLSDHGLDTLDLSEEEEEAAGASGHQDKVKKLKQQAVLSDKGLLTGKQHIQKIPKTQH